MAVSNNNNIYIKNGNSWDKKIFTSTTEIIDNKTITINAQTNKENYLATLIPYYKPDGTSSIGTGMLLDLKNGIINGYDLRLKGTKSGTNKSIIIDSSSDTTPLWIGANGKSNFNVTWDGYLSCNKVSTLNNDGRSNMAVSIGNNFYVTPGGAAGGSGANFGGNFSGGFSGVGSGTFKGKGIFDTLIVGGETYSKQRATFVTDLSLTRSGKNIQYRYTIEHLYVLATGAQSSWNSVFSTGPSIDHTHLISS